MGQHSNGHPSQSNIRFGAGRTYVQPVSSDLEDLYTGLPRHARPAYERALLSYNERLRPVALLRHEVWAWYEGLLGWIPGRLGQFLRGILYRPFLKKAGRRLIIAEGVKIVAPWNLECGDYVNIATGVLLNCHGGLKIGDYSGLAPRCIANTTTHTTYDHDSVMRWQGLEAAPIVLEDNVWVSSQCVISPGVTIGTGVIVAANSVVTRSVPPYLLVGGMPAKPLAHRLPTDGQTVTVRPPEFFEHELSK